MRVWLRDIFTNPGAWLSMSLMFILVSLPVVTWGCSCTLLALYARKHADGRKFKCFPECRTFFSTKAALLGFLFGLIDIFFILALYLSLHSLLSKEATVISRLASGFFLWVDALYFLSCIYRYPLLAANKTISFSEALSRSILLTISNLGNIVLIFMVTIFVAMISACAGILLFAFLPGGLAMLYCYNYRAKFGELNLDENSH